MKNTTGNASFITTEQVIERLKAPKGMIHAIPLGVKENQIYVISDEENKKRREDGKKSSFFDDCGIWAKGTTVRSYFIEDSHGMKYVTNKNSRYCLEKKIGGKKVYTEIVPQPASVLILNRYYTKLKSSTDFWRRVSWIDGAHYL